MPALLNNNVNFLTSREWVPSGTEPRFGILDLLWATVVTSIIAMLIAVPLGVGVALFITQYAPALAARAGRRHRSTCWPRSRRSSTASGA